MTRSYESNPIGFPSTRRDLLRGATTVAAVGVLAGGSTALAADAKAVRKNAAEGRLKQSVCRWCYGKIPLDELCSAGKRMGLVGIDLLTPPSSRPSRSTAWSAP
ncbi:hypothetical protein BSF38_00610 [Paludisphaera borealis]|uniref:Hydroxypyruvate isomerase n=1 Tax=Paludisphaera borealis TaxID=1387353 RepID=A0A1U7CJS8_9BACT|nr:hypothetical protein [Paludisphaera borealis]APW59195.1 hypothetical protein BSF38_00610 [Paludisphaera borealis]